MATWGDASATWADAVVTWTGDGATPPPTEQPGGHRRPPMRLTLDLTPQDDDEEALLVAFLRHRFRL